MEMSFKEAASHAKRMKLFLRAFEKTEGMLSTAARAESAQKEAEAESLKLLAANNEMSGRVEELKGEENEMKASALQEKKRTDVESDKLARNMAEKLRGVLAEIEEAKAEAKLAAGAAKTQLRADIEALGAARAEAERELVRVERLVSSLQQKVGGLG